MTHTLVPALRHSHANVVTARVEGINFYSPIRVGNFVVIDAQLTFVCATRPAKAK